MEGCEDAPVTGVTVEAVDAESVLFDGIGTGGLCDTVLAVIRATDVTLMYDGCSANSRALRYSDSYASGGGHDNG